MKDTKTRTLKCRKKVQKSKIPHVKSVNNQKYRLTPVKLESKKQAKKVIAEREEKGWDVPFDSGGPIRVPLIIIPLDRLFIRGLFSN